jgi:intein/homing endonuclease
MIEVEGVNGGQTLNYYFGKKLRTNLNEAEGLAAEDLATKYDRKKYLELVAVKNYRTWEEYPEKFKIISVEKKEGFFQNECTEWAPGGDAQWGANRFSLGMAKKHGLPIIPSDDCLAVGSIVRCIDGYKPVELIKPGDVVVAHDGGVSEVEETRGFFTKKKCVEIDVGGIPLILTKDHRVWAKRALRYEGGVYPLLKNTEVVPEWIDAGDLKVSDLVYVPKQKFVDLEGSFRFDLSEYVNHKWRFTVVEDMVTVTNHINGERIDFKRYLSINNDVLWIMGFFVGDGNAHNNLTSFVAETETYHILRLKLVSLTNALRMKFDEKHLKNYSVFRIINTCFTQFMRKSFYNEHKEKIIPNWVLKTGREGVVSFLSGLMYADGSSYGGGKDADTRYSLSMTSLSVIGFVREVALSLGTYCSIGRRRTTGSVLPLYTINFPPEISLILKLWKTPRERRASRWIEDENGYWIRIKNIAEKGEDFLVYDLQVSRSGSYSTLGFAVHNSHFATRQDKEVQDVRLAQSGGWRFYESYHMQSSDEAFEYFQKHHNITEQEFEGWIDNSIAYAERFKGFKFKTEPSLPVKFYPEDTLGHLKKLIQKYGRFVNKPEYAVRLKTELDVIHRNGKIDLLPYFFLAEEQVRVYANQKQLTGCGRGSSAGCLISYLIGITHIDPLKYGLSFERFLTLDRIQSGRYPDIDLDFPDRKLFVGSEGEPVDVVEFEAEDGSKHTVPENMRFETDKGLLTVQDALAQGADINPWWKEKVNGK